MHETLELTKQLINCPSVTPEDAGCQSVIATRLKKLGFTVESLNIEGVTNLWARLGNQHPLLVLAGHTDVVPAGDLSQWDTPPFEATVINDKLQGRGAADMKGSLAAMVTACERLITPTNKPSLNGSLAFLITSDEEGPSIHGTKAVLKELKERNEIPDWCLVGEPSSEHHLGDVVKVGRRGSITGFLTIKGKQGHIAYPHLAHNPIHDALKTLPRLLDIDWGKPEDLFPKTVLQIANINAGTGATNVIPGSLSVNFNLRYAPPLTVETIQSKIETCLSELDVTFDLKWHHSGDSFYTPLTSPLVASVQKNIQKRLDITTRCCTKGGTSDGRFFSKYGTHVVELGPLNNTIHQVNEQVSIADLAVLSALYEDIIRDLLT